MSAGRFGVGRYWAVLALALAAMVAPPSTARAAAPTWRVRPFTAVSHAFADSIAPLSATNVWLVGHRFNSISQEFAIAAHRTRSGWRMTSLPGTTSGSGTSCCSILTSVSAIGKHDVWAVGAEFETSAVHALIEHWNGLQWTKVAAPHDPNPGDGLHSVSAVSANDVWAVGSDDGGSLVEHWDGTRWSVVPAVATASGLESVVAVSAHDVWVGGGEGFLEHWNGSSWADDSQAVFARFPFSRLVRVPGTDHLWLVASNFNGGVTSFYNGSTWTMRPLAPGKYSYAISGLAVSRTTAWLIAPIDRNRARTLVERWNGSAWQHAKVRLHYGQWFTIAHVPGSTQFYGFGKDPTSRIARYH
jgi:hypothetical protein